jgi:ABC-type multidrug transport system fused ATPase/permease subunit
MMTRQQIKAALPTLSAILGLGTFLAILGPYGSAAFGWPWIWVYWTGLMALGWLAGIGIGEGLDRWASHWPETTRYIVASFLVAIPVTIAVAIIQIVNGNDLNLLEYALLYILVWVVSAGVTVLTWLTARRKADDAERKIGRALLDKLPHKLRRATVLALESEDHYLRVHTDVGDALILIRLTDAITAVETLEGARTHRSWWVAKDAVETVSRGDGRAVLTLSNGVEAPVSRTYSAKLREAGWY